MSVKTSKGKNFVDSRKEIWETHEYKGNSEELLGGSRFTVEILPASPVSLYERR